MAELKLSRLPDRTPVKLQISVPPELNKSLHNYAQLYKQAYGDEETVAELIPFMLQEFLSGDREFKRAAKK